MPEDLVCCTVGRLVGDAWMTIPSLVDLCKTHRVRLVHGTYAGPVYEWARRNVKGANWETVEVVEDPDEHTHPFCPGFGTKAMNPALEFVKQKYPRAIGHMEIEEGYRHGIVEPVAELTGPHPWRRDHIAIQPYTKHDWKNCGDVVGRVSYRRPVHVLGLPGEPVVSRAWAVPGSFDAMCDSVLSCSFFVGILSSWTNFAALFEIPQIIVSFTEDVPIANPNAAMLVEPSVDQLQAEVDRFLRK